MGQADQLQDKITDVGPNIKYNLIKHSGTHKVTQKQTVHLAFERS